MKRGPAAKNPGGVIRGILGAFLLAFLAALCWFEIISWVIEWSFAAKLSLLLVFLVGPAACLGYWLFRGLRKRRFAYCTTMVCTVLALFPALPAAVTLEVLPRCGSLAEAFRWARSSFEAPEYWAIWIFSSLFALSGARFGQARLLRYTDPAWYKSPLRAALARSGGAALCNHWSPSAGFGLLVPDAFDVNADAGRVLRVRGEDIRVEFPLRKGRTFSAWDVAGVIIGPGNGYNVLYSFQYEFLARFTMSEKNAEVFVQYLREHGVPFYPVSSPLPAELRASEQSQGPEEENPGEAVPNTAVPAGQQEEEEEEKEQEKILHHTDLSCFSRDFTVQLRPARNIELPVIFGFFLAGFLSVAVTPFAGICFGAPAVFAVLIAAVCAIAGPLVWATVSGQMFPPRLSVESGQLWLLPAFGRYRRIRMEELGGLRFEDSDECYILYDKTGKTLAKFSTRDEFGTQLMNFLLDHNIKLRSKP